MGITRAHFFNAIARLLSDDYKVIEDTLAEEIKPFIFPNIRILDIGCGTGRFSRIVPEAEYTGIDLDGKYIQYAKKYRTEIFEKMDARNLNFSDGRFGCIFSVGLFHHLSGEDAILVLKEVKRVLAPGGRFLIIDAVWPQKRSNLAGFILRKLDRGKYVRSKPEYLKLVSEEFIIAKHYVKRYGVLEFVFLLTESADK